MFRKLQNIGKEVVQTAEGKTKLGSELKKAQKDVKIVRNIVKQGEQLFGKEKSSSGGSSSSSNSGENSDNQSGDSSNEDGNQNQNNGGNNQTSTQVKEGINLAKDVFKLGQNLVEKKGDAGQDLKQVFDIAKDAFSLGKTFLSKKKSNNANNNSGNNQIKEGTTLAKDALKLGQGALQKGGSGGDNGGGSGGEVQEGLTLAKDAFKLGSSLMNKNGDKSQQIKQGIAVAKDIFKLGESIEENKGGSVGDQLNEAKEGFNILKSVVKFGMGLMGSKNKKKSEKEKKQTPASTPIADKTQNNDSPSQNVPQPVAQQVEQQEQEIDESQNVEFSSNFSSPISIIGLLKWKLQQGKLTHQNITLGDRTILIKDIKKIKCLSQETLPGKCKIKITKKDNQQFVFGADTVDDIKSKFSHHYLWYAHLICNKLLSMDHKIDKPFTPQHKQFKPNNITKSFCKGMLHKRSQHFKEWQERYVIINQKGLFSYKIPNQNHSFSIKAHSAKYIWTRFQIQNERLVIKIKHGVQQTEFGIPIVNFCKKSRHNWLYSFYRIIMERKLTKLTKSQSPKADKQ